MTRWFRSAAALVAMALPLVLEAQAVPAAPLTHGTLAFDADASLGAFTGTTSILTGQLIGASSLAGVRGWVAADTKTLSTHNGHRDSDMAGSLEIAKYPTMRFDLDSVSMGGTVGDSTAVVLLGRFTIHGQTHPASVPGFAWITASGARFRGAVPMNVKDYGVGGLSKMLGVLKMNEMITVRMDVAFGQ